MRKNSEHHYSPSLQALHWLFVLLLIAVYASIELRVIYPKGSDPREDIKALHFMLGVGVLVLALLRVWARIASGAAPRILPTPPLWQQRLAAVAHGLLYLLILMMPLSGWVILSAAGKPIPFFGLELPPITGKDPDFSKAIESWHELAGKLGYGLIALHVVAALYHHLVVKDDTLKRMLPGKR